MFAKKSECMKRRQRHQIDFPGQLKTEYDVFTCKEPEGEQNT